MDLTPQEQEEFEFRQRFEQEQDQTTPKTLAGLGQNALSDVGDLIQGAANVATGPAGKIMSGDVASAIPELVQQGKQFWSNPKENLAKMVEPVTHPIEYGYQHPVSQALNVSAVAAPLADTAAQYAGRFAEGQMGKLHGTSQPQFRQLGQEKFGDTMRASYDAGDANLLQGSIGREEAIAKRIKDLGAEVGDIRGQAEAAGPTMTPTEMAQKIQAELGADYAPGGKHYGEQGTFNASLENIKNMPEGGITKFAQRATDIKGNAAGNRLTLPLKSKAEVDIANKLSRVNDAEINARLPDSGYEGVKDQFGYAKTLDPMELRGQAKEMLGASPNTAFGTAKKIAHTMIGGPKLGAQVGFGAETALESMAGFAPTAAAGGIGSHLMAILGTNPQSLGKYAAPLQQAAAQGGKNAVSAMHYVLSLTHPEYNQLTQEKP